jgi:cobalt-zinc-cadmium resistance protein CzcA
LISKIISYSVHNKKVILIAIALLLVVGIYNVTKLPIDAVPDITDNQVQVITVSPSLSAEDLERMVTIPIENSIASIKGLKNYRSFSRFGLSLITIVFEDNVDIYWARQQVSERLAMVQRNIPPSFGSPELAPITTGLGEIFQYTLTAQKGYESKFSLSELRSIQDWLVRKQLLGVKGVADVSSFGGKLKQYQIEVNPEYVQASGFTVFDIFDAVEMNNSNTGSAYLEKNSSTYFIRTEGLLKTPADIENTLVVSKKTGTKILLKNLAEVKEGAATRYGALIMNGRNEAAGGIVMMLKGENSNVVISNIKDKLTEVNKLLPKGVVLKPFLDRTKLVNNSIKTVAKNLTEGAIIVILVLIFFLGNFRAAFIVASIIPLSMLIAIILMNFFGVSGNLMSLGAIDFGIIVDGAVIIIESILLYLHHISKDKLHEKNNIDQLVVNNTNKLMSSALFGQLIIIIVYFPLFTLKGIEGKMFMPMVQTIIFALLGALVLSLTYIPAMSALFLKQGGDTSIAWSERMISKLEENYKKLFYKVLEYKKGLLYSFIGLFIGSVALFMNMGGEFVPIIAEGDFAVETRLLTGSSLSATIEHSNIAAKILKDSFEEVEQVVTKIGSGEIPTDPMPLEAADMMVILKDKSEWKNANTFDELAEKMSQKIELASGVLFSFQYPVQMRFNELLSGAKQDVVCKLYGENLDTLAHYGEKIFKEVKSCEGAEDIFLETITGVPQIIISYDRNRLQNYDLSIDDVNKVIQASNAGAVVGNLYEGERKIDITLKLNKSQVEDIESIKQIKLSTNNGQIVPLNEIAEVKLINGANQIQRDLGKRRMIIGFNARGRDVESIVQELQAKVNKKIQFPTNYYMNYGGSYQNLKDAKNRLILVVPLALIAIILLLQYTLKNWRLVWILFSIVPLSTIGGILFLAMRGLPFSISAGVGFIALFGISVLNGIVLINEVINRKLDVNQLQIVDILDICKTRLRPILMTATVASLGFLPMAVNTSLGAEIQRPLATVVIGGLLSSTLATLVILPILLLWKTNVKSSSSK